MKHLIAMLIALALTSSLAMAGQRNPEGDKLLGRLQAEKDKLKRLTDPVDRTLSDIKISEMLITLMSDSVKAEDMKSMQALVSDYLSTIREAHEAMIKTGRDAHKKPRGFKELEISLRRQTKQLKDLGNTLTLDDRGPLEKAGQEASSLRDDLLRALFGS